MEEWGDRVCYVLPANRGKGIYFWSRLFYFLLGAVFVVGPLVGFEWGIGAGGIFNGHRPLDVGAFVLALVLALPFMAIGCVIMFLVVISLFAFHCEIVIDSDMLVVTNCNGPWRRRHRRPRAALRRLRVMQVHGVKTSGDDEQPVDERFEIRARFEKRANLDFGIGYPPELLNELAEDLARRCKLAEPVEVAPLRAGAASDGDSASDRR